MANNYYQIGGSLDYKAPTYIERQADGELHRALLAGEFCYVFTSRQMGKSSLMVRSWHQLQEEGHRCAVVDVTYFNTAIGITNDEDIADIKE